MRNHTSELPFCGLHTMNGFHIFNACKQLNNYYNSGFYITHRTNTQNLGNLTRKFSENIAQCGPRLLSLDIFKLQSLYT